MDEENRPPCPGSIDDAEWSLRLDLAACYRLFDWFGWCTLIYNHISVRVPASEPQFLINPFGLHYGEVTARNLVKIDIAGRKLDSSPHPVNAAGFVIHGAIHAARPDAHCIAHTHTTAGMAVACKQSGLRYDNFNAALLYGRVAYHAFEGITTDESEKPRLVASLGEKNILILRNHGLLVAGLSVHDVLATMATLQMACEVQVASDTLAGPNIPIDERVLAAIPVQNAVMATGRSSPNRLVFDGCRRRAGIRYENLAG